MTVEQFFKKFKTLKGLLGKFLFSPKFYCTVRTLTVRAAFLCNFVNTSQCV